MGVEQVKPILEIVWTFAYPVLVVLATYFGGKLALKIGAKLNIQLKKAELDIIKNQIQQAMGYADQRTKEALKVAKSGKKVAGDAKLVWALEYLNKSVDKKLVEKYGEKFADIIKAELKGTNGA